MDLRGQSEGAMPLGATGASPVIKEVRIMGAQRKCIRLGRMNSGGTAGVNALVPSNWGKGFFVVLRRMYHGDYTMAGAASSKEIDPMA